MKGYWQITRTFLNHKRAFQSRELTVILYYKSKQDKLLFCFISSRFIYGFQFLNYSMKEFYIFHVILLIYYHYYKQNESLWIGYNNSREKEKEILL